MRMAFLVKPQIAYKIQIFRSVKYYDTYKLPGGICIISHYINSVLFRTTRHEPIRSLKFSLMTVTL